MRLQPLAAFALTMGIVPLLFARIGESPETCDQRYGPGLKAAPPTRGFWATEQRHEKNGIRIVIRFLRNEDGSLRAGYVEYKPLNPSEFNFSSDRIQSLLETVSADWTKLTPIPLPPPPPTNAPTNSIKSLVRTSKVKVITLEQKGGIEERRQKKEAAERKARLDSIESQNLELKRLKDKMGKVTRPGLTYWQCPQAYAAANDSLLIIISQAYLEAYEKQVEDTTKALKTF